MSEPIFQTWTAARIADACGGEVFGRRELTVSGLIHDSRKVEPGQLFVALVAERDGHDFIAHARERGACAYLVNRARRPEPADGEAVIAVDDTFAALARLGRALFDAHRVCRADAVVIGVTGSNGKTTTKELAAQILSVAAGHEVLRSEGNLNNHIGLPLTLSRIGCHHRLAVLEMGASQVGDIALLTRIAPVDRAAVTTVAPAHLEGLGNEAQVIAEKGGIFRAEPPARLAVIPHRLRDAGLIPPGFEGAVRTFGEEPEADVRLTSYRPGAPARIGLAVSAMAIEVPLGLVGHHNALNLAAAVALVWDLLPAEGRAGVVAEAAGGARPIAGRLVWRSGRSGAWVLDDSYNANPGSVRAALDAVSERQGRRWLILGDMLELGEAAGAAHRAIGRVAAESGCERVWAVGQWARAVVEGCEEAGLRDVAAFDDAASCAEAAREALGPDDVVLVKGSRGVHLEEVVSAVAAEEDG